MFFVLKGDKNEQHFFVLDRSPTILAQFCFMLKTSGSVLFRFKILRFSFLGWKFCSFGVLLQIRHSQAFRFIFDPYRNISRSYNLVWFWRLEMLESFQFSSIKSLELKTPFILVLFHFAIGKKNCFGPKFNYRDSFLFSMQNYHILRFSSIPSEIYPFQSKIQLSWSTFVPG